jgi:acyl-ACP thioesterase
MQPIYSKQFTVDGQSVDRFGRLRRSTMLRYAQEVAGEHCALICMDYDALAEKGMFWAVVRNRISVTRLPREGETITVETWPMPTTRTAYPRATAAYDANGQELFRSVSLWVLMDIRERSMVLPAKSGVEVLGTLRGNELASPRSLAPKNLELTQNRYVSFTDLDINGHMNNARYLDWIDDLLPSEFHRINQPVEINLCYVNEAKESDLLAVTYQCENQELLVDIRRNSGENSTERVFSASISYET